MRRNPISTILLAAGLLMIVFGIFVGALLGVNEYKDFSYAIALPWWLFGILSGLFFAGLSEIVHLLQKIYNRGQQNTIQNVAKSRDVDNISNHSDNKLGQTHLTKINALTILLGHKKIKGALWITDTELKIMEKSIFESDEKAKIIETIPIHEITDYTRDKDYLVFRYDQGQNTFAFKTHTIADYQLVIDLLNRKSSNTLHNTDFVE